MSLDTAAKRDKHPIAVAAAILGLMVLLLAVMLKAEVVAHNVWAFGEPIGGMPPVEAVDLIRKKADILANDPVAFVAGDRQVQIQPNEMRLIVDMNLIDDAVNGYVAPRSRLLPAFLLKIGRKSVLAAPANPSGPNVRATLENIAAALTCQPEPAHYAFEGRDLKIVPPKDGQLVTADDVMSSVKTVSGPVINVPFQVLKAPESRLTELSLLAEFSTPYRIEETDRNVNLELAAAAVHLKCIQPGETYSFNAAAGERTLAKGYRYANVVVGDSLVPGIAGGICQVTTTLFDAAAMAGLDFPEIHAHGIPVEYVEPGLDAAVAWDYWDLKVKNTTGSPVVFGAWVEDGEVTVRVFGEKTDSVFELESVIVAEYPEAGKKPGLLVDTYRVEKRDGKVVDKKLIMRSRYLATTSKEGDR